MADDQTRIPLRVDIGRIIEVLASQIYPSPLALLRENAQNAYDAILLRKQRDDKLSPEIRITIAPRGVTIQDNGIGMTRSDLEEHFWTAGSSSKNTEEARAAGVVGTFGIGAMANFGIANALIVETESAVTGERTRSEARRDTLSASEKCISIEQLAPAGRPGTQITATLDDTTDEINVEEAEAYIRQFVSFLRVPVYVNEELVSQQEFSDAMPAPRPAWETRDNIELTATMTGTIFMRGAAGGEVWLSIENLQERGESVSGGIVVAQGHGQIRTFRSGFGLATIGVSSVYQFGGLVDLLTLEPTAGREALSTASMQIIQSLISRLDAIASENLGHKPESNGNTQFMDWALQHRRFDLCDHLKIRREPNSQEMLLSEVRSLSNPLPFYRGSEHEIIGAFSSDDKGLLVVAARNPRRGCEEGYIDQYCKDTTTEVSDKPQVLSTIEPSTYSSALWGVAQRLNSIIEQDYFLPNMVEFGKISHTLPLFVDTSSEPITLTLDPASSSLSVLIGLYDSDYSAYPSMAKDFVRTIVFPRIQDIVPSSTKQGAAAFLKTISRHREVFQYEARDREDLSKIWEDYLSGNISLGEATTRSVTAVRRSVDVVTTASARQVSDVVPDLLSNEEALDQPQDDDGLGPAPPITRTEISTDAKLLTIAQDAQSLKAYRCFLALSDSTVRERGDFFLQPHTTEIVWGGQKTLFVFQHHSRGFGLYYDVQSDRLVSPESGGGAFQTCTIILKDRIFIPIPDAISESFIPPTDKSIRLEIRSDILYIDM